MLSSSAPFPFFVGSGTTVTETVVVTVSVIVISKDATGGRDVVLLIVTVGATDEVIVVGGKVSGVRPVQRLLKSSRSGSNTLTKFGSIGTTQFAHCWTSVSLASVQRQEIAVQDSYNAEAGVHILTHWSGTG